MRIQPYKAAPADHPEPWIEDGPPTELWRWAEDHAFNPTELQLAISLLRRPGEYFGGGPPDLAPFYRLVSLEPVIIMLANQVRIC